MIDELQQSFAFLEQTMQLRDQRQKILSTNIANADTPNYQARDFDFGKVLNQRLQGFDSPQSLRLQLTNAAHIKAGGLAMYDPSLQYRIPSAISFDNNTVDMDLERINFADNSQHIESTLTLLTNKIKSLNAVMQND